jgi:hypothetical protein
MFAVEALIFVAFAWATPVWAHDIDEVRGELRKQGFDQLDFQRAKPPFKLDACRGGERFHLHVDYYGKIIEQTSIGSCGKDAATQPATAAPPDATSPPANAARNEGSSIVTSDTPGRAQAPKPSRDADKPAKQAPAEELCSRYFAELGQSLQVPCGR